MFHVSSGSNEDKDRKPRCRRNETLITATELPSFHALDSQSCALILDVSLIRTLTVMHVAVSLGGVQLDGLQEVALGLRLLPLGVKHQRYC